MTVKLLLLDEEERLLLVRGRDPLSQDTHWYPVGGGVEPGESLQQAAAREAYEETGLSALPQGVRVWFRDHTYFFGGRTTEVHEDWLLHSVRHFEPVPANLSDAERTSVVGFRWWRADELCRTSDSVFPPGLGPILADLLRDGPPAEPTDIGDRSVR